MVDKIADDVVVTMAYRMLVEDEVIEDAPADDPLYYLHGGDNIVPGLEAALVGKTVGDKLSVQLAPADAYGEYDEEALQEADIEDFELPEGITVGDEVEVEDAEGDLYLATIKAITDEILTLDFNSPMAGKTITFEVEILNLRAASETEIAMGEPQEYIDLLAGDHDHDH